MENSKQQQALELICRYKKELLPLHSIEDRYLWLQKAGFYFYKERGIWIPILQEAMMFLNQWVVLYPDIIPLYHTFDSKSIQPVHSLHDRLKVFFVKNKQWVIDTQCILTNEKSLHYANVRKQYPIDIIWTFTDNRLPHIKIENKGRVTCLVYRFQEDKNLQMTWVNVEAFSITPNGENYEVAYCEAEKAAKDFFDYLFEQE